MTDVDMYVSGVVYITYSKASEAALAQEEMNGRLMDGYPKPLKVMHQSSLLFTSSTPGGSTVTDPEVMLEFCQMFI